MTFSVLGIFLAGLLTFASPCILPLVPVYLAILGGASANELHGGRRAVRAVVSAAAFAVGLGAVFVLLGMAATAAGRALVSHRTLVMQLGGLAVFLFGLKYLGVLQVPWLERDFRPLHAVRGSGSVLGALLLGATFGLGWTPCVGPVLGSVLTYAATATSSPLTGGYYLAAFAAGVAVPLVALAAVAPLALGWIRRLQRYMRPMQVATGAILAVVGVLLITDSMSVLESVVAASPLSAVASVERGEPPAEVPRETAAAVCEAGSKEGGCGLPEERAGAPAVAIAQLPAGPAMVEFISNACPICMRMRPIVSAARRDCAGHGVRVETIEVDRPGGRALARRHGVLGVPTFLFIDRNGREVARLVGEQAHSELAQALEVLAGRKCASFRAFPE